MAQLFSFGVKTMPHFTHVSELLQSGETALCIFTRGLHLQVGRDGHGTTGHWVVDPNRTFDRVIIYHRQSEDAQDNDLFRARCGGYVGPDEVGRYTITLTDIEPLGTTTSAWAAFADAGQNPIRYFTKT